MAKGQQRDPKREAYWRRVIGQWRESGLGVRPFCRREKLSEPSFYAWRRVIAERDRQRPTAPRGRRPSCRILGILGYWGILGTHPIYLDGVGRSG